MSDVTPKGTETHRLRTDDLEEIGNLLGCLGCSVQNLVGESCCQPDVTVICLQSNPEESWAIYTAMPTDLWVL